MPIHLRRALPVLGVALLVANVASAAPPRPAPGQDGALSLDGNPAGTIGAVDVPAATSDVIVEPKGADAFLKKHLGNVHYPDIAFTLGADAATPLIDWIAAGWQLKYNRKNGTVVTGGTRYEFFNALVTDVAFPALEVGSSEKATIAVEIAPEYTRVGRSDGGKAVRGTSLAALSSSDFGVALSGLDTGNVIRVDRFTVKQTITENPVGELRDYEKEPGKIEFPNISLYVRPSDAQSFAAWHDDFVVKGNCGAANEKTGSIAYYSEDKRHVFTVQLSGVGITSIRDFVIDDQPVLRVDLYVERMELVRESKGQGAAAPSKSGKATRSTAARRKTGTSPPRRKTVSARRPIPGKPSSGRVPKE